MMPSLSLMSSPFTSGTTSGTFSFMRHAELLSITRAPDSAATGPYIKAMSPLAANSATSMPLNAASLSSSTFSELPLYGTVKPFDRSDARAMTCSLGNCRCARTRSISFPTIPVAPTTATFNRLEVGTAKYCFDPGRIGDGGAGVYLRRASLLLPLHGDHERRMHIAKLDDAVGLPRSDRPNLRSRRNQGRHKQTTEQADGQEQKAKPKEHAGDRCCRGITGREPENRSDGPGNRACDQQSDGNPECERRGPAAGACQGQVTTGPLRHNGCDDR